MAKAYTYLQHSKYGSQKSVRINNNSSYLTGYAAKYEPTTGYTGTNELCKNTPLACNEYGGSNSGQDSEYNTEYFNKASVVASTTGNYTGVYDMAGGSWEYMMAGLDDNSTGDGHTGKLSSGRHNIYNFGFNGKLTCPQCNDSGIEVNHNITQITGEIELPVNKNYYDKYEYDGSNSTYNRGILGDATKEMGPFQSISYKNQTRNINSWYEDESYFIHSGSPWIVRGGVYSGGTGAGVFVFDNAVGYANGSFGYRFVLAN